MSNHETETESKHGSGHELQARARAPPSTYHAAQGAVEGHEEGPSVRATAEARAVQQQDDDARGTAGDDGVHDGLGHRRRVALLANGRLGAPVEGEEPEQEDEAPQSSQLGEAKEGLTLRTKGRFWMKRGFIPVLFVFLCLSRMTEKEGGCLLQRLGLRKTSI